MIRVISMQPFIPAVNRIMVRLGDVVMSIYRYPRFIDWWATQSIVGVMAKAGEQLGMDQVNYFLREMGKNVGLPTVDYLAEDDVASFSKFRFRPIVGLDFLRKDHHIMIPPVL